jgi:hypothetical protein
MHLFRKRHAASVQRKNPRSLGKDAGSRVVVRMAARRQVPSGRREVCFAASGSVAATKPKAAGCHGQQSAPDHFVYKEYTRLSSLCGLDKATMSTSLGPHVIQRPQDRRRKVLFYHLSFPTTLIHMHSFISSAVDTLLGNSKTGSPARRARRRDSFMLSSYFAEGLSLCSRDPEAKKYEKILPVYPHEQTAFAALRNRKLSTLFVIRNSRGKSR